MKITLSCCLCDNSYTAQIEKPIGWRSRYEPIELEDEDHCFCPDHAIIAEWTQDQCSGCVGGWGDCSFWKDFAFKENLLTEEDHQSIQSGICPRRTNGTLFVNTKDKTIDNVDLSDRSSVESGRALSNAIKEYVEKYNTPSP